MSMTPIASMEQSVERKYLQNLKKKTLENQSKTNRKIKRVKNLNGFLGILS